MPPAAENPETHDEDIDEPLREAGMLNEKEVRGFMARLSSAVLIRNAEAVDQNGGDTFEPVGLT